MNHLQRNGGLDRAQHKVACRARKVTQLALKVGLVSIEPVADLELSVSLFLVVECLCDLVTETTLFDDLADQSFIAVLEIVFRL